MQGNSINFLTLTMGGGVSQGLIKTNSARSATRQRQSQRERQLLRSTGPTGSTVLRNFRNATTRPRQTPYFYRIEPVSLEIGAVGNTFERYSELISLLIVSVNSV